MAIIKMYKNTSLKNQGATQSGILPPKLIICR